MYEAIIFSILKRISKDFHAAFLRDMGLNEAEAERLAEQGSKEIEKGHHVLGLFAEPDAARALEPVVDYAVNKVADHMEGDQGASFGEIAYGLAKFYVKLHLSRPPGGEAGADSESGKPPPVEPPSDGR
jgi:hypothetical protein